MRAAVASFLLFFTQAVSASTLIDLGQLLSTPRSHPTVLSIDDRRVLVLGGNASEIMIEIVDPWARSTQAAPAAPAVPLDDHAGVRLSDGRLLVTGGSYTGDRTILSGSWGNARADIFDPTSGQVTTAGSMHERRMLHQATRLADGRVLITGGCTIQKSGMVTVRYVTSSAEIYDPATGTFHLVASMQSTRFRHTATLLADGRVLLTGGADNQPWPVWSMTLATTEIFDPSTETFSAGPSMATPRIGHTATLLQDGRVAIAGGGVRVDEAPEEITLEIFNPATNLLETAADIGARWGHSATLLTEGRVLFFGGAADAVVYDPDSNSIQWRSPLAAARRNHTAALLPGGAVVILGGSTPREDGASIVTRDATLFFPDMPRRRTAGR